MDDRPKARDFLVDSLQATTFFPSGDVPIKRILTEFYGSVADVFDGTPTSLPGGMSGMPDEIARLTLRSGDECWSIEVAGNRTNLHWRRQRGGSHDVTESDFFAQAARIFRALILLDSREVNRLAAVIGRFVRHEKPARVLAEHFCKDQWLEEPFNRPESFELHSHKRYSFREALTVNSWVRCRTGFENTVDRRIPVVSCQQDINTLAEEQITARFDAGAVDEFFGAVPGEFDQVLGLYFPN
jgi:hypothetical protein